MASPIINKQTEEVISAEEVISKLLYRKYIENIKKPNDYAYNSFNKQSRDIVTVSGKDYKRMYFNFIEKIDNMKINMVRVSISYCGKTKTSPIGKLHLEINSDSIRVVDRYLQCEDASWFEDEACSCLYSQPIMDYTGKKIKEFSYENIKEIVDCVTQKVNNLVFDKFTGVFVLKSEKEDRQKEVNAYKTIFNCETISLKIGECVVCLEDTRTTTHCCGKNLCRYCWDKIKVINTEEHGFPDSKLPCPNCRKNLRYDYS